MTEIISAAEYYGPHASGTVVLVNGSPTHFTGATSYRDAKDFEKKIAK